jgi:hypothetical protein
MGGAGFSCRASFLHFYTFPQFKSITQTFDSCHFLTIYISDVKKSAVNNVRLTSSPLKLALFYL